LNVGDAAPTLRMLLNPADEALGEIAYALATVGDESDVEPILSAAATSSDVTRRRCLLAVAKLYGCEECLYRLMVDDAVTRDSSLLSWAKQNPNRMKALSAYHAGDDALAWSHLAGEDSRFAAIAESGISDGFLLATSLN
jgi:hypothetical protein